MAEISVNSLEGRSILLEKLKKEEKYGMKFPLEVCGVCGKIGLDFKLEFRDSDMFIRLCPTCHKSYDKYKKEISACEDKHKKEYFSELEQILERWRNCG